MANEISCLICRLVGGQGDKVSSRWLQLGKIVCFELSWGNCLLAARPLEPRGDALRVCLLPRNADAVDGFLPQDFALAAEQAPVIPFPHHQWASVIPSSRLCWFRSPGWSQLVPKRISPLLRSCLRWLRRSTLVMFLTLFILVFSIADPLQLDLMRFLPFALGIAILAGDLAFPVTHQGTLGPQRRRQLPCALSDKLIDFQSSSDFALFIRVEIGQIVEVKVRGLLIQLTKFVVDIEY